mmetsp:Transcript_27374/g.63887  ORF Transcript_27374/g.63887 Transcript_27374/m.63887 type:complete len:292 (+) Transcript_27374:489-1364(+)
MEEWDCRRMKQLLSTMTDRHNEARSPRSYVSGRSSNSRRTPMMSLRFCQRIRTVTLRARRPQRSNVLVDTRQVRVSTRRWITCGTRIPISSLTKHRARTVALLAVSLQPAMRRWWTTRSWSSLRAAKTKMASIWIKTVRTLTLCSPWILCPWGDGFTGVTAAMTLFPVMSPCGSMLQCTSWPKPHRTPQTCQHHWTLSTATDRLSWTWRRKWVQRDGLVQCAGGSLPPPMSTKSSTMQRQRPSRDSTMKGSSPWWPSSRCRSLLPNGSRLAALSCCSLFMPWRREHMQVQA